MALLGNYSVYHKLPDKFLTGTTLYGDRANFNKPGMMRSMGVGSGNNWAKASIPHGFGSFGAWMLPRTAGAMVSRYVARVTIEGSGIGAAGKNAVGTCLFTIEGLGTGGLIAGAIGSATLTIDGSGAIRAIISGIGAATITIDGTADLGALGWLVGTGTLTLDATMDSYAIGWMVGTTDYSTELTSQAIATAVWAALQSEIGDSGTAGAALLAAGSAGDPWTTLMAGYTDDATFGAWVKKLLSVGKFIALK